MAPRPSIDLFRDHGTYYLENHIKFIGPVIIPQIVFESGSILFFTQRTSYGVSLEPLY